MCLYVDAYVGYTYNNLLTKLLDISSLVCRLYFTHTKKGRLSWLIRKYLLVFIIMSSTMVQRLSKLYRQSP